MGLIKMKRKLDIVEKFRSNTINLEERSIEWAGNESKQSQNHNEIIHNQLNSSIKWDRIKLGLGTLKIPKPLLSHIHAFQISVILIAVLMQSIIQYKFLGWFDAPFTLSAWLLGSSIAYVFNR